jgi:hypothetical protein
VAVLVLDRKKRPLMPCTPKRARKLLASGRARVHRLFPFCIRLVDRRIEQSAVQPLRLSMDPGSKTTGLAISRIEESVDAAGVIGPVMHIVFLMEPGHRGRAIMDSPAMTGNFNVQSGIAGAETVQGISHKHCRVMQRADGYGYAWHPTQITQPKARAATA